jgi:hypothetical protein
MGREPGGRLHRTEAHRRVRLTDVGEPVEKAALRRFAEAAVRHVAESGQGLQPFLGVALHRPARDAQFTSLSEFKEAELAIADMALVGERYGTDQAKRLALQVVYELLKVLDEPRWDDEAFDRMWEGFTAELDESQWTHRGVANLRNFQSDSQLTDLGDGVSIRGRDPDELAALGFSGADLQGLFDDWDGFGASSHVMLVEDRIVKDPERFTVARLGPEWRKAQRALQAMRLLTPGDIGIGRMWVTRDAHFNVGSAGTGTVGFSIPAMGSPYVLEESVAAMVPDVYGELRDLEERGYDRAPGNLDLALRSFTSTYDRWPPGADSRVVDSITAFEALLGIDAELAFKLSFRVAGLVGGDDAERVRIFNQMKAFYDTRSKLVHGGTLKPKHQALLENVDELRGLLRTLLRGFMRLGMTEHPYGGKSFTEELDAALQDDAARRALRRALRFT